MVNRSLLYLYLKISSMWLWRVTTMVLPAMYMCPNICILALYCPQDYHKSSQ